MDCKSCINKDICNIYNVIYDFKYVADIDITNCRFFNNKKQINKDNIFSDSNNIALLKNDDHKDYDKIKKLSNRNRAEKNNSQHDSKKYINDKIKIIALNEDETKTILDTKCPTCGALTFKEDLVPCSECGKIICSSCGTIDNVSPERILCEECWLK